MTVTINRLKLLIAVGLFCQVAGRAAEPTKAGGAKQSPSEPDWVEFAVTPQAVPEQRLKYRLFPDHADRVPGNAAPILLRLPWGQNRAYWSDLDKADRFLKMSATNFAFAPDVRKQAPMYWGQLDELRRAAFRTDADWQYAVREQRLDRVLLPEVQELPKVLRALAVHCRVDVAEGKVEDAIDKITIGLGVADHLGKTPFLVVKGTQTVMVEWMLDRTEELTQVATAPNLYWGLAMLPAPLVDLRPAIDWERRMLLSVVPELRDRSKPRSEEEWSRTARKLVDLANEWKPAESFDAFKEAGRSEEALRKKFVARARDQLGKLDKELAPRVGAMSESEVAVRYFAVVYLRYLDQSLAALALPPPAGLELGRRIDRQVRDQSREAPELRAVPLPARLYARAWSLQRRVAALQAVEALRDYAARGGGKLPERLADIVETPVLPDPLTGRPFGYRLTDGAAEITGEAIDVDGEPRYGIRWHVRLRK